MASKIYAGTSAFVANILGNAHNWYDNHARPFLSVTMTDLLGKKTYDDLFINTKDVKIVVTESTSRKITVPANSTALIIPNDIKRPMFSRLVKS